MTDRPTHITTHNLRPERPERWWRRLCWAHPQIAVSGDLPDASADAAATASVWREAGITHIIDLRDEADTTFERNRLARLLPDATYIPLGTDDDGRDRPGEWYQRGIETAQAILVDPEARILIHCHMGVNRAPSMTFAVLVALGIPAIEALESIRSARPIAAMIYAGDAIEQWQRTQGASTLDAAIARLEVEQWLDQHPVDTRWIISRIWRAEINLGLAG